MSKVNWWLVMAGTGIVALIVILFLLPIRLSSARDFGQWDCSDPPDSPMPVMAKNSNALSIGFTHAAVRNLRDCDENQRRPSKAALD